ncbi:MAG: hypothetical protein ACYCOR_19070 [Acidobacteriaceae bacterium]
MYDQQLTDYDARQQSLFSGLRFLFGIVWAINTALEANAAYIRRFLHSMVARIPGQPALIQAYLRNAVAVVRTIGPSHVAMVTIALDAVIAASLLTGLWVRPAAWLGVIYSLLLWSTVGGFGGPFTTGATDPGTAIVYALVFLCVLVVPSDAGWRVAGRPRMAAVRGGMDGVRVLFGLLWAFDAFWKWQPYFLRHGLALLTAAEAGQPRWIAMYIAAFVPVLGWLGPVIFGVAVAVTESVIALGLLLKRAQSLVLPLGALYSLVLWTTAEGWGGPYGPGVTGNRGDMLGTTNIYVLVFLYLMVAYRFAKPVKAGSMAATGELT